MYLALSILGAVVGILLVLIDFCGLLAFFVVCADKFVGAVDNVLSRSFLQRGKRQNSHARPMDRNEVAAAIESFLDGRGTKNDWKNFVNATFVDHELDAVRRRCEKIEWTTDAGQGRLREELQKLRQLAR